MSLSDGPTFALIIGEYLDGLGYTVPADERFVGSASLLSAWETFCVANNIDTLKYKSPSPQALSTEQALAVDAIYASHSDLIAANQKFWNDRDKEQAKNHTDMIVQIAARSSQLTALDEHITERMAKRNNGMCTIERAADFMTETDRQKIQSKGKKKFKTFLAALSNNPTAK